MSLSRALIGYGRLLSRRVNVNSSCSFNRVQKKVFNHQPLAAASFSTQTKGDMELSSFLTTEIAAEEKARKHVQLPTIDGFDISVSGANVKLTRHSDNELMTIDLNVNHSVDAEDDSPQGSPDAGAGQMLSKPNFYVILERSGQKLLLSCTFHAETPSHDQSDYDDAFQIVELSMYSGSEVEEADYSVSGDIMDAHLYDLLMNMLEERGITNEFAGQLIELSTSYEHRLYIDLLQKLKNFVSK